MPVLDRVLELDFEVAVASTGSPAGKAELAAFRDRLGTFVERATSLIKAGVAQDRFLERPDTSDLGWTMQLDSETISDVYADLSRAS